MLNRNLRTIYVISNEKAKKEEDKNMLLPNNSVGFFSITINRTSIN